MVESTYKPWSSAVTAGGSFSDGGAVHDIIQDRSPADAKAIVGAIEGGSRPTGAGFDLKGLLGDEHMMGNLTGLAGTVMQALALPDMLKNAKLQNKSLQFNLDTAKQEQAQRTKNISSFNKHKTSTPTSAFV